MTKMGTFPSFAPHNVNGGYTLDFGQSAAICDRARRSIVRRPFGRLQGLQRMAASHRIPVLWKVREPR